jgi:hypothetical protein
MPKTKVVFQTNNTYSDKEAIYSIAKNNILQEILLVISEKQMILHTENLF